MRVPRTFVFVDLSGFTNYTAAFGDNAAGRILSTFRAIVREVASDRGVRIAKWLGDGFMVVGVEQIDAITFTLELERRATDVCAPLTLRAGIASGHALLFEGDDYIGSAVNMAARLCDVAQPYEVLMPTMHDRSSARGRHGRPVRRDRVAGLPRCDRRRAPHGCPRARTDQRHRRALDPQPVRLPIRCALTQTRRGVAFSTDSTLGTSASSDLGHSEGNGFFTRCADDLDAIAELGVRAVRLSLDWARLQPRPKELDGEWVEWYGSLLTTALGLGLEPWLTLYDGSIPTWFDDEGGFGDAVAAGRWWPRWVERVADQFGDAAAGWVPLVGRVDNARPVWRDTWIALRGGRSGRPAVRAPRRSTVARRRRPVVRSRRCRARTDVDRDRRSIDDRLAERELERMGELLRMAAEEGPERPLAIASFGSSLLDPDSHGRVVEQLRLAIDDVVSDGVVVEVAFVGPAVSVGEDHLGLVDRDVGPTPAGEVWFG